MYLATWSVRGVMEFSECVGFNVPLDVMWWSSGTWAAYNRRLGDAMKTYADVSEWRRLPCTPCDGLQSQSRLSLDTLRLCQTCILHSYWHCCHCRHKIFEVWRWNLRLLVHFGELKTTFPVPILTVAAQETSGGSKPRYFPCLRHPYLRKCRSPTVMTYEIIRPSDSCSHNITMLFSNERVLVGCWWNRELKMRLSWRWLTTDRWLCTNIR